MWAKCGFKSMIWDLPWLLDFDAGKTGPPPHMPLGSCRFAVVRDISEEWITLVGTALTVVEARQRLADAWIPCLWSDGRLVGTCVLRNNPKDVTNWALETLKAPGYGTLLLYQTFAWLYARNPRFRLAYVWELSLPGLVAAWWRGWLWSATAIEYGWIWTAGCGFCGGYHRPIVMPVYIQGATVIDSGLGDGWGYVQEYRGTPDWSVVGKKWRGLWMRASQRPEGWSWSGEFVVVGAIRQGSLWATPEIALGA
jgi:hypothetical protein